MTRRAVLAGPLALLLITPGVHAGPSSKAPAATAPAAERPRVPAEWEPALGAMVAWPPIVPEALLVEIARDDRLYLVVRDEKARSEAQAAIAKLKIDPGRVEYIVAKAGDARSWPRDWGPFPLFGANGEFRLADPTFLDYPIATGSCDGRQLSERVLWLADFAPDDAATDPVARVLGVPRIPLPYVLTGGNALVDGHGTAFSTCALPGENLRSLGITGGDFRADLERDLGIRRYVVVPNFEWVGIQHIDCLLKPLDEETLLVKRVPKSHPDYGTIESIVKTLSSLDGPYGRPYRLVRIDAPPYRFGYFVANYTNSLILNRKVLVPLFGIPADDAALETFRKALPGYEVIGFRNPGRDGWNWTDALHCRIRAVWDPGMLWISHARLAESVAPAASYRIEAEIRDYSRAGLIPTELKLFWRTRGETAWHEMPLEAVPEPHHYAASIPGAGPGRTMEYYLAAADRSGRRETLPRVAPRGTCSFSILETKL